jgi:MEDS: MEthanogen/methylotroph, DcmR Sensory domain
MSSSTVHSVYFYDADAALIARLRGIVASGLRQGNAALIVATDQHRQELTNALRKDGIDTDARIREKRLTMCDAEQMLAKFMAGGRPDSMLFQSSVGQLLREARKTSTKKEQDLIVFGEMVAVLWERGNKAGALALEHLWNDLLSQRAFHLHCAYPRSLFSGDALGMANICDSHSHIFGAMTARNDQENPQLSAS